MAMIRMRYGSALGTVDVSSVLVALAQGVHTQYDHFEHKKDPWQCQCAQLNVGSISILRVSGDIPSSSEVHETKCKVSE